MKVLWKTELDRLSCQWCDVGERIPLNTTWIQDAPESTSKNVQTPSLNFTSHSPFGSGEWYVPWNARWNVPDTRIR
jgi:hypothetical protein